MKAQAIAQTLHNTVKDDQDLMGLMVFNLPKQEIIASTFPVDYTEKTIQFEKSFKDLAGEAAASLGSAGEMNWFMKSLERKVLYSVRISEEVYLFGETKVTEAPSSAIEDGLEIALEIGRML
jgi:hypothetical protein